MVKIIQMPGGRIANNPYDLYGTPRNFISAVLDIFPTTYQPSKILDPGAGGGRWGFVARHKWPTAQIEGVEINPVVEQPPQGIYDLWRTMDFREYSGDQSFDLVIGNPPYSISEGKKDLLLAEKFINNGLAALKPNGYLMYLLKTVYLEGEGRGFGLFRNTPPKYVFQSVRRIPFMPEKGNSTNTYAYCMMLWQKDFVPTDTIVRWFEWRTGVLQYVRDYPPI